MNLKKIRIISALAFITLVFKSQGLYEIRPLKTITISKKTATVPNAQQTFREAMQKLWNDHVVWTHEYIVSVLNDIPNAKNAAERLLKNQDDIGAAIVPYYGKAAGDGLTKLLRDHILIAVDLVDAVKNNNKDKITVSSKKWKENAQEIAAFLSKANPYWPEQVLQAMLNKHLELTTNQVVAHFNKQWKEDVSFYDQIRQQATEMANALSQGIIQQFPQKF